jgi:diguanylate cyclase (GGDEF)-like protein
MSAPPDASGALESALAAAEAFDTLTNGAPIAAAPRAFLRDALAQLASLLEISACAILVPADGGLHCAAAVGLPAACAEAIGSVMCDGASAAAVGGEPRVIGDVRALGPAIGGSLLLEHGFRCCWSVSLTAPDGRALGAFVVAEREPEPPAAEALELAAGYGSVIALALDRLNREASLASRSQAVVAALIAALDARDEYAGGRAAETSEIAMCVGQRLGMDPDELERLAQIAVLHDIGKLGIPTETLQKEGPLDVAEEAMMREHPIIGERILSGVPELGEVALAVRCAHERWDGRGYPDGLAGEQIPLAARIVAACVSWQAMTTDRPYRPALSSPAARAELRGGAGSQFDPRVVQALLESLGDRVPVPACSPSESRDRALSLELTEIARSIGAEDLFVFRRIAERHFAHHGGVGRGAGWAGNIELDSRDERHLGSALLGGAPVAIALERSGRIVGPYWGRSAIVVPCDEDTVVVFGSPTEALADASMEAAAALAERARSLVIDVSPAKRLADEVEVLAAVREVTTVHADGVGDTLVAIAARARTALSAEFAAIATIPTPGVDAAIGIDVGGWEPRDLGAAGRALASFGAAATRLPLLCQDLSEFDAAPEGFRHEDGVSSLHVLPIGAPPLAVLLVVHAEPGLRGFTALCQRVAVAMSDAAEAVVRRGIAQERLKVENAELGERLRTDALTGVASRSAWEEALAAEQQALGPDRAPVSVVIVDLDGLKTVNDGAGHAAGDELLRRCARLLAGSVRSTDLVARIGGDEFGVLLRGTDEAQARIWCERLRARMEAANLTSPTYSLRWSLGCASVPPRASIVAAVAAADRAMYAMKSRARAMRR